MSRRSETQCATPNLSLKGESNAPINCSGDRSQSMECMKSALKNKKIDINLEILEVKKTTGTNYSNYNFLHAD